MASQQNPDKSILGSLDTTTPDCPEPLNDPVGISKATNIAPALEALTTQLMQSLVLGRHDDPLLQAYLSTNFESSLVGAPGTAQFLESTSAAEIVENFSRKVHEHPTHGIEILDVKAQLKRAGIKRTVNRAVVWVSLRSRNYQCHEMMTTRDGIWSGRLGEERGEWDVDLCEACRPYWTWSVAWRGVMC